MKLSIIIPYYNAKVYTDELLDILNKQMTPDVQVILIDDGSNEAYSTKYEWCEVYRQKNQGVSAARNAGLEKVKGEYVAYIDSDDIVSDNYISLILNKIDTEHFDFCYLSWQSFGGWDYTVKLRTIEDKFPPFNLCCWNRIYKFDLIKDIRFNTHKQIAEDAEYIREAEKVCKKKSFIPDIIYHYRSNTPDSLTKKFANGKLTTQRVVYHYNYITRDMDYLIDEIAKINQYAEVIVMTNKNDLPELEQYAMVMKPDLMKGTELRGEPTRLFSKISMPLKTNLVIWTEKTFAIGGIETWIYYFCMNMKDKYDIIVLYDEMDIQQIQRLAGHVKVIKNNKDMPIVCDALICNRISDPVPSNVKYDKKIQMVHSSKLKKEWRIPSNYDTIIPVSEGVKESFIEEINTDKCSVINNFTYKGEVKRALRLISATRLSFEKGENRMIALANMLNQANIPFIWTIFSERPLKAMPNGMVFMNPTLDIKNYIAGSDYLVQLSDNEAFGYSMIEALELGVPIITTPVPSLEDMGFKDKYHGFIVPFDMSNVDVQEIYNTHLDFQYKYHNEDIKEDWLKTLPAPSHIDNLNVTLATDRVLIRSKIKYKDTQLNKLIQKDEIYSVPLERAQQIVNAKYAEYC